MLASANGVTRDVTDDPIRMSTRVGREPWRQTRGGSKRRRGRAKDVAGPTGAQHPPQSIPWLDNRNLQSTAYLRI